jgi:hypothetical protein
VAKQLSIGHRKGARGNSAEACFRDIKRHGPATEATRMSARSIVILARLLSTAEWFDESTR